MNSRITVSELKDRLAHEPNLRMVDVRSAGEYNAGHVPAAVNIPLEQLDARLDDLGEGPIAVLCQSGRRAGIACEMLHRDDLLLVEGGTKAWIEAGNDVVATTSTRWALERQVRLMAGLMVLIGTLLAVLVAPGWIYLAMFVGAGLTFAGITNICGMASLLAKLPWNRPQSRGQADHNEVTA